MAIAETTSHPAFGVAACGCRLCAGRHRARARVALQALQVGANVCRMLVSQGAILLEALVDDALQFRRHVGIQAYHGDGTLVENGIEHQRRAVSAKWPGARPHLIEDHTEGEQVRAGVQRCRADLLWRHVRDGPYRAARVGQQRLSRTGWFL